MAEKLMLQYNREADVLYVNTASPMPSRSLRKSGCVGTQRWSPACRNGTATGRIELLTTRKIRSTIFRDGADQKTLRQVYPL